MTLAINPINPARPDFVGEVSGVDLRQGITAAEAVAIEAGMDRFGVLVFHDQDIDDQQQLAFSRHFGPLETATGDIVQGEARRLPVEVNDISNLERSGKVMARDDRKRLFSLGNMLWHSDSSFKPTPAKYSLLSARVVPGSGGNTEFADMRAAWDALDAETKALVRDLVTEHSQLFSRGILGFTDFTPEEVAKWQPVPQRLVRRHPRTGRLSLFLSAHAGAIQGWPVPEARALLRDLTEHATQREFVHAHVWRPHDLVVWDNRVTMHRARRYDATQVRDLHRTTVADVAPTLEQAA
ncbi:TauD/TfdA dioxygenase family protein [Siccirubricoccus phaeus]|uniref:TauD/TfdA dioxygenase family protein n=1 Tax=Siccirubricoccus phaeus TaxID=2595053 RepID=UPI0011F1388D|nr:TauD/TfdA family dioxygenase [Siccirubricoccus phaeus]